jgi:hypothetical protein
VAQSSGRFFCHDFARLHRATVSCFGTCIFQCKRLSSGAQCRCRRWRGCVEFAEYPSMSGAREARCRPFYASQFCLLCCSHHYFPKNALAPFWRGKKTTRCPVLHDGLARDLTRLPHPSLARCLYGGGGVRISGTLARKTGRLVTFSLPQN